MTGKVMEPVTTMQIYKGAIPFLILQLTMVGVLIAFLLIRGHGESLDEEIIPAGRETVAPERDDVPANEVGVPVA